MKIPRKMKAMMKLMKGSELNLKTFCISLNITKKLDIDIDGLFLTHSKEFITQNWPILEEWPRVNFAL